MFSFENPNNQERKELDLEKTAEQTAGFAFEIIEANNGKMPENSEEARKIAEANDIKFAA